MTAFVVTRELERLEQLSREVSEEGFLNPADLDFVVCSVPRIERYCYAMMDHEIAAASVNPGDVIFVKLALFLNQEQVNFMRDRFAQQFPGVKIVILSLGSDSEITILSPQWTVKALKWKRLMKARRQDD